MASRGIQGPDPVSAELRRGDILRSDLALIRT
jgi:hypothetical protein